MELKEDDVVMCTVRKIEGTTVFVDIDENGQGTIVMSEIAAGRIRNIRDYVSVGKKIVCKVLKLTKGHIELSLRRVTAKEKEEIKDKYEKERSLLNMLKSVVKNPEEILKKIKQEYEARDFLEEAKINPKIIEKFFPKLEAEAFAKILSEKKEKEKVVKKNITIKSFSSAGINDIKEVLRVPKNVEISYLGSSKFAISSKGKDFKEANYKVQTAIEQIKNKAKEKKIIFEEN
ncbi:MAG: S1 RNA-binding domain-containing protein [Candidatus Pacearchaeota archaeon]